MRLCCMPLGQPPTPCRLPDCRLRCSLGVLLWEMWQGERAWREALKSQVMVWVLSGRGLEAQADMPPDLAVRAPDPGGGGRAPCMLAWLQHAESACCDVACGPAAAR